MNTELLLWTLIFIGSLALLVKSSDLFVDASEQIGSFFGLPAFLIGVVIVSIGTSLPELVSSILAVRSGSSEIVIGNVIGSNITNIFLVIGAAGILCGEMVVQRDVFRYDMSFLLGTALLLGVMVIDLRIQPGETVVLIALLIGYFWFLSKRPEEALSEFSELSAIEEKASKKPGFWPWFLLAASPFGIYFGAEYLVESVITLSRLIGIGSEVIALSAVALGTSLPEVMVSVSAVRKGKVDIAVGNVVGSNIFNTLAVTGGASLFGTLLIPESILTFAMPISIGATILLLVVLFDRRITRLESFMLLVFYVVFIGMLYGFI